MTTHAKLECQQADKIDRIEKALFYGNGKPSMTSQIDVINSNLTAMEKKIDGALNIGKTIVLAFLGLIVVDVYQMFKSHTAKQEYTHAVNAK